MKPVRPLSPIIPDLILALLLAIALWLPWTLGRLISEWWEGE